MKSSLLVFYLRPCDSFKSHLERDTAFFVSHRGNLSELIWSTAKHTNTW